MAAGVYVARKRMKSRKGIEGSGAFSWNVSTCRLALKFDVARCLKAMGAVAEVVRVQANNSERTLEITYREKPAFSNSRGTNVTFKYYLSLGYAMTIRKERFAVPFKCVASRSSTFSVSRNGEDIQAVIVDLDYRSAPFSVPREVVNKAEVEQIIRTMSKSDDKWTLYPNCTLHLTIPCDSLKGPPVVLVDPANRMVKLGNNALQDKGFNIPSECLARSPKEVKYMLLERGADDATVTELLLIMEEAGDTESKTWTEIRKISDVQGEIDVSFLLDADKDDEDGDALLQINK